VKEIEEELSSCLLMAKLHECKNGETVRQMVAGLSFAKNSKSVI
jgi:hypothetical protein